MLPILVLVVHTAAPFEDTRIANPEDAATAMAAVVV
jgi:hypothetical protein